MSKHGAGICLIYHNIGNAACAEASLVTSMHVQHVSAAALPNQTSARSSIAYAPCFSWSTQ